MPHSLFESKQAAGILNFTLHVVWKLFFFKPVFNFLPFNFAKCLHVLWLWNREKRRLWVMLLIALGWKSDPALTGKWQICLSGFMSWQGEPALCDWWIFSGRPCGWCKEPSCSALLCSAQRDAAQAAWELELSGAGLGNEEGAHVQAPCCQSAPRQEVQHRPP